MKIKTRRYSKSMLSVIMALCMLVSCITVGLVPTNAARVGDESVGWNNTTWYLGNNLQNVWDNSASAATMTNSSTGKYYYDFYLRENDSDVYYRPYEKDNYAMGPTDGNNTKVTTTGTAGSGYDDNRCWKFECADLQHNTKYYKVRIWIDTSGNSGNGWSWYAATLYENLSPTISLSNNSPVAGTAVTITADATTGNKIGSLEYKYEVSSDNGANYTTLADYKSGTTQSWTPSASGTYKLRISVKDKGVVVGTNARTERIETTTQDVTVANPSYTVNISAKTGNSVSTTGGTVSPSSYTNLTEGHAEKTITATPETNYYFNGWTCANNKVTFADVNSTTTTFTSTGADTIYANFVTDTVYNVTVNNGRPSASSTVQAGTYVTPTLTAAAADDDEYSFSGWNHTGNVTLVSGYNWSDSTIKIKASASGATVTATYTKTDYIYFYAALQSNWNSNPIVTVDGAEVGVYQWISDHEDSNSTAKTLYSDGNSNSRIGENNCYTYYIGVFRVPTTKVGKNISVFNSVQTGTNTNNGYIGTVTDDQGKMYYTYSNGSGNNHSGTLAPQKVTLVTTNKSDYDGDETVTVSKTEKVYYNLKTAGQDDYTYTYQLINASTSAVVTTLPSNQASSNGTYTFVPDNYSVAAGDYKVRIITKDSTTSRIVNYCDSAQFAIQTTPTQATVTYSGTNSTVSTHTYVYKNGSVTSFNSGASLRAGSSVTLVYTINNGYTQGTTTVTGVSLSNITETYNASNRKLTITFTVPSGVNAVTVTHTPSEITHRVYVKKRLTKADNSTEIISTAVQTITGVGISTTGTVNAAPAVTDYTFTKFTLPTTGITLASGSLTDTASFTINATVDDEIIYIDYSETLYTLTLVNQDNNGTIKKSNGSSAISSIQVGNVTGVTLVATANNGYRFNGWTKSSNAVTIGNAANYSTTFKTNANATVTANYTAIGYNINASVTPAAGATVLTTDTSGNQISGGIIGDTFEIRITLNQGYALADTPITFATGDGYAQPIAQNGYPSPALSDGYPTSGNTVTYRYKLGAGSVAATVHLKAKTPTLSNVRIKDRTHLSSALENCQTYSDGATVDHNYKQPIEAIATTDNFTSSSLSYATKSTDSDSTYLGTSNTTPCNIAANTTIIPTAVEDCVTYRFYVTATNAPTGVDPVSVTYKYTIRVYFNNTQKDYFRLNEVWSQFTRELTSNNPYYTDAAAQIVAYNDAYDDANGFYTKGYPAYNDTSTTTYYNDLISATGTLMAKAKYTTVYVLSKNSQDTSYPMNITMSTTGTDADWKRFTMYSAYQRTVTGTKKISSSATNYAYHMIYDGKVQSATNTSTYYYLYKISYPGCAKYQVWHGANANGASVINKLTEVVQSVTVSGTARTMAIAEKYYVNVSGVNDGTGTVPTCYLWSDFGHSKSYSGRPCCEIGDTINAGGIRTMFGVQAAGSVISDPGDIKTTNTSIKITGPMGKANSSVSELVDTGSINYASEFTALYQGKYKVEYTTNFGTDESGVTDAPITRTESMYFWVSYDDVTIYIDMNDNVGIPVLNIKYFTDLNGNPVPYTSLTNHIPDQPSGSNIAYLPYEMSLVTGSESIYKYTIKFSKLRHDYYIGCHQENGNTVNDSIIISYITVENEKIGEGTGFSIVDDARITGEIWLKADSTHLKTFKTIAYGSVNTSFTAATVSGNTYNVLGSAVSTLHGTGVITDVNDIHSEQYAGSETAEGLLPFKHVLKAGVKQEVTINGNTYYFDKWVRFKTPADDPVTNGVLSVPTGTGEVTDYSYSSDLNFTSAFDYNDGDCDYTYVALYKLVAQPGDTTVRVQIKYEFQDYNTADGNYIYDPDKSTVNASYTKTVKIQTGAGQTYVSFAAVQAAVDTIARNYAPYVKSNYFDYTYVSASVDENGALEDQGKLVVTATLSEQARKYYIIAKYGANTHTYEGYYQQPAEIKASDVTDSGVANPAWKTTDNQVVGTGATINARFVSSGNETGNTDSGYCQMLTLSNDSSASTTNKSVVSNSYTEVFYDGNTEKLNHNFYIIDYCAEGKLLGGGVLFATTDSNGNYRQTNASSVLNTALNRKNFISGILGSDVSTEYTAQTINNVGFRYKPFKLSNDVFNYSDDYHAYLTMYSGSNVNSDSYAGQRLRLFSFMVYDNNGTPEIVVSDGYGEVERYQPQS